MSHIPQSHPSGNRTVRKPRTGAVASQSYDPLATVKLPPPASDGAYGWINGHSSMSAGGINTLRTPNSILRPGEDNLMKRKSMPSVESTKRAKHITPESNPPRQRRDEYPIRPASNRSIVMPETQADNSRQWSAYFSRAFPGFEFGNDRPNSANLPINDANSSHFMPPGAQFNNFTSIQPNSHSSHANAMLSPNSPHANSGYVLTPTRSERPHSISSGSSYYDATTSFMIPPPPPSVLASNVPRFELGERYTFTRPPGPEFHHVEVPPPDKMPPLEDDGTKPNYSYAMLIGMAILRAPERKLTLSQIYKWIMDTFAYYRKSKPAWHNSIRHNLSLNKAFEKRVRPKDDPGKGSYWTIVDGLEYQFFKPNKPKKIDMLTSSTGEASQRIQTDSVPRARGYARDYALYGQLNSNPFPSYDDRAGNMARSMPNIHHNLQTERKMEPVKEMEQAVSYYTSQQQDTIPSDGTEPDDRLIEEREKMEKDKFSNNEEGPAVYSKKHVSEFENKSPLANRELPQMRAMSTGSSKNFPRLPSSQGKSQIQSGQNSPAVNIGGNNSELTFDRNNDANMNGKNDNEWRGQGQFAFRCSTPSMVRNNNPAASAEHQQTLDAAIGIIPPIRMSQPLRPHEPSGLNPHRRPQSALPRQDFVESEFNVYNDIQVGALSQSPNRSPILRKVTSASSNTSRLATPYAENRSKDASKSSGMHASDQQPRTPEKNYRNSMAAIPSTNRHKIQFLRPSMLQRQSLESPYAGTLDFSPGLSLTDGQPLGSHSHQKQSSFTNLADFLDLDFYAKDTVPNRHSRTGSESSEEGTGNGLNPSNAVVTHNNILGPSSHVNNFTIPFDLELSPKMVVTPVRRPFDTPIRDQSHAYSPYYRASNGKGSPMRRL